MADWDLTPQRGSLLQNWWEWGVRNDNTEECMQIYPPIAVHFYSSFFLHWISLNLHQRQANQIKNHLLCFDTLKQRAQYALTYQTLQEKMQREDVKDKPFIWVWSQRAGNQKLSLCHWKQSFLENRVRIRVSSEIVLEGWFLKIISFPVNLIVVSPLDRLNPRLFSYKLEGLFLPPWNCDLETST